MQKFDPAGEACGAGRDGQREGGEDCEWMGRKEGAEAVEKGEEVVWLRGGRWVEKWREKGR